MPAYTLQMTSWIPIDFRSQSAALNGAMASFNRVSARSANPKRILSVRAVRKDRLEINFYSNGSLRQGREANALWYFSRALSRYQSFAACLTPKRRLLRRV